MCHLGSLHPLRTTGSRVAQQPPKPSDWDRAAASSLGKMASKLCFLHLSSTAAAEALGLDRSGL